MTEIPAVYMDLLLEKKAFAHLATVMPDGSPQNTPVWFDFVGGKVRVNSALGRTKTRNMKQGAKVRSQSWVRTIPTATSSSAAR